MPKKAKPYKVHPGLKAIQEANRSRGGPRREVQAGLSTLGVLTPNDPRVIEQEKRLRRQKKEEARAEQHETAVYSRRYLQREKQAAAKAKERHNMTPEEWREHKQTLRPGSAEYKQAVQFESDALAREERLP